MTDTEERPTTQERYQRATQSSNLRPTRVGTTGDVDVIGAAGMAGDSLGALLFRLVGEWDACKGEKALYEAEAARLYEAQRRAHKAGQTDEAKQLAEDARREVMTGRAMILLQLGTLRQAKQALFSRVLSLIAEKGQPSLENVAAALTGRILDVFLDPTCPPCEGRGFNGGHHRGERQIICRACRGSGSRRDDVGKTPSERFLAALMLAEMSRKMTEAEKSIRRSLNEMER